MKFRMRGILCAKELARLPTLLPQDLLAKGIRIARPFCVIWVGVDFATAVEMRLATTVTEVVRLALHLSFGEKSHCACKG